MKFTLPMPPGIDNTYGIHGSVMYKKALAKAWEQEAGYEIINQRNKQKIQTKLPLLNGVIMGIEWFYKYNRDIDSGLKILLDLFQKQGIYKNDMQVRRFSHYGIQPDKQNPRVEVEIEDLLKAY